MEITKNPANASFVAVFPNDKSKKYKIKYLDLWGYHGSQYVWVKNPDGTTQTFGYDEATRSVLESHNGSASQILNHLLGK